MKVLLAKSAGFCYGVKRAVELAAKTGEETGGCWMLGDLIHKTHVVEGLAGLGIRKADQATGFFTVWGIILLIFGVFGLTSGIFSLLGICNLLGGIAAPILFIVGGGQNKKAAAK